MTRKFKFYKEEDNRWFVDLPEWEGDKEDLEMVMGADILLEILSGNSDYCYVTEFVFGKYPGKIYYK